MKLHELFTDDKAVSPVVGVALLIAMTVILAAVIGTVVLGLGSNPAESPQATFSFDTYEDADTGTMVEIVHDGGDALDGDEIKIVGSDADAPDEWTAGQEVTGSVDTDADTIRVVWEDSDSDKTSTLAEYEV